jgi:hypothetical protein
MKSEQPSASNIYLNYDANMQHFPIGFTADKKTDGFNPLPHISSEYDEHMLCARMQNLLCIFVGLNYDF